MKIHIGLNVTNLDASLVFYSKIFGTKPVKVKQDYVKFLLDDPGLNFTLRKVDHVEGNHINHFGFQIYSTDELNQHRERLKKEGFFSRSENDTTCCYARQDKFWITDPDGHEWEFFFTKEDTEVDTSHTCCG